MKLVALLLDDDVSVNFLPAGVLCAAELVDRATILHPEEGAALGAGIVASFKRALELGQATALPKVKPTGITYMDRPIEELPREKLVELIVGQDFVIQRRAEASQK